MPDAPRNCELLQRYRILVNFTEFLKLLKIHEFY